MDSRNNKLKITGQNRWYTSWSLILLPTFFLLIFLWLKLSNSDPLLVHSMFIAFGSGFLIDLLSTLYLHWQYYRVNKGEEYAIERDKIVRWKQGKQEEFLAKDIMLVNITLSPALYKKSNVHFMGIEAYYYACVYLKNGEKLILTCLLHPKLDDILHQLKGVAIKRKKRVFNPLQWNYI